MKNIISKVGNVFVSVVAVVMTMDAIQVMGVGKTLAGIGVGVSALAILFIYADRYTTYKTKKAVLLIKRL